MNAETINPIQATIVIAIAVIWLASLVVFFLKGKPWSAILGIAAVVANAFGPPTINGLYLFNPLITLFSFLPIWGAIRLGRPDFYWGSWFYSKNWLKYMRAVRRYGKEEKYWQLVRQGPDGEEREKLLKAVAGIRQQASGAIRSAVAWAFTEPDSAAHALVQVG